MSGGAAPAAAAALLADPALTRVLALLDCGGEEARLVGGAVRNALLGVAVHEFDVATTATPTIVMERASAAGLRCIPTGIAHGTVTVMVDGRGVEVTTLREDIETDGRHARVRFGRDFAGDALRRDFTMNALSMTADRRLFDYVGGLADIAARRVRFIGDPAQRIREDFLRVLRFFRFAAEYGEGPLDRDGLAAAIGGRDGLAHLSRERVGAEVLKLLAGRRAADIVQEICDAGLLGPLLASAPNPARLRRLSHRDAGDPLLRLAALCVYVPEDAQRLRDYLRLPNAAQTRLAAAAAASIALHGCDGPPPPGVLRTLLFQHGRTAALDATMLVEAESRAPDPPAWDAARRFLRDTPEPHLPFSGADLIARGIVHGPAIGEALKDLQARWIKAGFPQEPHVLARLLEAAAAAAQSGSQRGGS